MDRSTPSISPLGPYTLFGSEAAAVIGRRARLVPALLAAALLVFALPAARALEPKVTIDLGQNAGAPPAHFDFLPRLRNRWILIEDGTAVGGLAIERRGTPSTVEHSLAIYSAASPKDAEIGIRIKTTGGTEDQGGGIALRLTAPDDYYLVQLDARITTNEWHRLAVRAEEDEFVVSLDGVWVFTAFDKTLTHAGHIALWTASDSVTRFDSITIAPPLPSAKQW
jgi:hypothetical protein